MVLRTVWSVLWSECVGHWNLRKLYSKCETPLWQDRPCRMKSYNPSGEDEVCRGARRSRVALLDFPRPWFFNLQLLFINFKFPDLGVNHFHAIMESSLNNTEKALFLRYFFFTTLFITFWICTNSSLTFPIQKQPPTCRTKLSSSYFSLNKNISSLIPSLAGNVMYLVHALNTKMVPFPF